MTQEPNRRLVTEAALEEFRMGLEDDYVVQSETGVWIGTQRYVSLADAIVAANAAGGGRIRFLGDETPTSLPAITSSDVQIEGGGGAKSILRLASGAGASLQIGSKTFNGPVSGINLSNFRIQGPGLSAVSKVGVSLVGVQFSDFYNLRVDGFGGSGSWGLVFDTLDDAHGNSASINNRVWGGYISNCYNGMRFTKDPGDSGTDGSNHNNVYGIKVAGFSGIGIDNDWGEYNKYFGIDSSSSVLSTNIGFRLNDDVCMIHGLRGDGCGTVLKMTATVSGYDVIGLTGNGAAKWLDLDSAAVTGYLRPRDGTHVNPYLVEGSSNINLTEVGYVPSNSSAYAIRRGDAAVSPMPNPRVCATQNADAATVGCFAAPGAITSVKCDAGAVSVGDQLIGSNVSNGCAMAGNSTTNPRYVIGTARTSKTAGAIGTVRCLIR